MNDDVRDAYSVLKKSPNQLVLRQGKEHLALFSHLGAFAAACRLLQALDWELGQEVGLAIGAREPRPIPPEQLEDTIRRVRAGGMNVSIDRHTRPAFWGPWDHRPSPATIAPAVNGSSVSARPGVRQFVKERAAPPVAPVKSAKTKAAEERKARLAERDSLQAQMDKGLVMTELFEDPVEQLRYEVRHMYLHTVSPRERTRNELDESYVLMSSFMADLGEQEGQISRAQMLAVIVDIVCGRVWEVNSRQARPMRDGGGDDGRPQIFRASDGALAWRANVSHGTPAARRIMWWVRPDGGVELARLATHDDVALPER